MSNHSKVGASAAKRWLTCPGSIKLIDELGAGNHLPPEDPSEAAEDGTFAHTVLEFSLRDNCYWRDSVKEAMIQTGREPPPWLETVMEAADEVLSPLVDTEQFWAEQRVTFAPAYDGFGTLDFAAWRPGRLTVADLKTGVGVRVVAQNNPQLMCYAVGALRMLGPERPVNVVEMIVIQPRVPGGITRWEITAKALKDWENNVLYPGLSNTQNSKPLLKAGEHCRFCPAMPFCPEQRKVAATINEAAIGEQQTDLAWVLENAPIIRKYLAEVEKLALRKALAGSPPNGYKVVPGKANRVWKDGSSEMLEAMFGDAAYDRRVKSPAQIEELPGGKEVALSFAYSPQGAPTLVKEDDPRAAWSAPTFQEMFK